MSVCLHMTAAHGPLDAECYDSSATGREEGEGERAAGQTAPGLWLASSAVALTLMASPRE